MSECHNFPPMRSMPVLAGGRLTRQ
jgi:hypothetical protein